MKDDVAARFWKRISLGLMRSKKNGDQAKWDAWSAKASNQLSAEAQKKRTKRLKDRLASLYGTTRPGKRLPEDARLDGRCCGCLNSGPNRKGAYCPTCRQRGAQFGWCGCGAALYSDGSCRKKTIHRIFLRNVSREDRKAKT